MFRGHTVSSGGRTVNFRRNGGRVERDSTISASTICQSFGLSLKSLLRPKRLFEANGKSSVDWSSWSARMREGMYSLGVLRSFPPTDIVSDSLSIADPDGSSVPLKAVGEN